MLYNTRHISELLNIAPSTVKKYCGMYGKFLSADATPEKGSHRLFSADDLKVFSFIVERHKAGETHDNITLDLVNGQRGELPPAHFEYSLTSSSREQVAMLTMRVNQLMAEVERLKPLEQENVELRALLHKAEADIENAQRAIERLNREIGRLEAGRGVIG